MDIKIAEEFLDELFSSLEAMETQSAAILQFLKDRGATSEQLAPYMEQASKASNVRWRAARLRLMSLFASAAKSPGEQPAKTSEAIQQEAQANEPNSQQAQDETAGQQVSEPAASQAQPLPEQVDTKKATVGPEKQSPEEQSPVKHAAEGDAAPVERHVAPQKTGQEDAA